MKIPVFVIVWFLVVGTIRESQSIPQTPQKLVNASVKTDLEVSNSSNIEEKAPKWVKKNPRQQHIEPLGAMLRLKCQAEGVPQPKISWKKDGVPIENVQRPHRHRGYIQKPDQWMLKIHGLLKSDEGDYECTVSNSKGSISWSQKVEVLQFLKDTPVLVDQSDNLTLIEGMTANFDCNFQSDLSMVVNWLRPAEKLRKQTTYHIDGTDPSNFETIVDTHGNLIKGRDLTINDVQPEDAGIYFCLAHTNSGHTVGTFHLTVLQKSAVILQEPKNVTLEEGGSAYFTCKSHEKLSTDSTSWVKLEDRFDEGFTVLSEGSEVLEIENITFSDEGYYACVVGNEVANVVAGAYLTVEDPKIVPINPQSHNYYVIGTVIVFVLIILMVAIAVLGRKWQQEKLQKKHAIDRARALSQWTKKVIIERQQNEDSSFAAPIVRIEKMRTSVGSANSRYRLASHDTMTTITEYELPIDQPWEFPRDRLVLDKVIGEGAFGKVMKGSAKTILKTEEVTTVAVKMLKEGHTDNDVIDLVAEMDLMKMIGRNINIINLLGVCTQDGPLYVIVEFAEHGNLRDFLRKHSDRNDDYERPNTSRPLISEKQLISFARQICKGMEYLASMKCIHRDLAARNILVAKDYVLKIADFGLARDVQKKEYYLKLGDGFLPIRWMAPESIFSKTYTLKSDIWSFGVVLWEMMSLGANPYSDLTVDQHFVFLRDKKRLQRPPNCSQEIYSIMLQCWNEEPLNRTTFSVLVEDFNRLLTNASESMYLDMGEVFSLASKSTGETLIADSEMGTFSSWESGQPWSFDSMGVPRSVAPQPPKVLPPISYSMASRRHQNSSGSSGLGSTSDEITYPQIIAGPNAYFTNNIYGMDQQLQPQQGAGQPNNFSTFRPPPLPPNMVPPPATVVPSSTALPLYANQYFASYPIIVPVEDDMKEVDTNVDLEEDEGINTMTPPKTPVEDYSKQQYGDPWTS